MRSLTLLPAILATAAISAPAMAEDVSPVADLSGMDFSLAAAAGPPAAQDASAPVPPGDIILADASIRDRIGGMRQPRDAEPADAATEPAADAQSAFDVEAVLSLVSDFRRGGISSSGGKVAVQGELSASHASGFYGSLWASSFDSAGGDDAEVDISAGYGFDLGSVHADISAIHYIFVGVSDSRYWEFGAALTHSLGPVDVSVGAAYTPAQANTGDADNLYLGIEAEWALDALPLTFSAAFGHENGAFGDHKLDWSLGATYGLAGFDVGLAYVDAARTSGAPHSGAALVLSLSRSF